MFRLLPNKTGPDGGPQDHLQLAMATKHPQIFPLALALAVTVGGISRRGVSTSVHCMSNLVIYNVACRVHWERTGSHCVVHLVIRHVRPLHSSLPAGGFNCATASSGV